MMLELPLSIYVLQVKVNVKSCNMKQAISKITCLRESVSSEDF